MTINPIEVMLDLIIWLSDITNALYTALFIDTYGVLGDLTVWAFISSPTGLAIFVGIIVIGFIINALLP